MSEHDKYKVNGVQHAAKRVPLAAQKSLLFENRPGYFRYVMNDLPGRREKFEKAGYTAVQNKDDNNCDKNITKGSHLGTDLRVTVNQGYTAPCQTATVMEIPLEWYNEDFIASQDVITEGEKAINNAQSPGRGFIGTSLQKEVKRDTK